ncbi:alginate export family protein [Luteimonas huabeiensis]|uniref:alginate export family protein n=1 Tax=Luteimonas huabeiensis TaxID=1244513 RepID=UPI000463452E|nr:alginate export family protein [Luteimonas huabeiensis]
MTARPTGRAAARIALPALLAASACAGAQAQAGESASTTSPYPLAAQGWGGRTGPDTWMSRWVEDWSPQASAGRAPGRFDRLKYIPLDEAGDVYLTLSTEHRFRSNYFDNPGLRDGPSQQQWLYRGFLGADLHLGEHVRAYAELAHGTLDGRNTNRPVSQHNDLTLQQAFVDLTGRWGSAETGLRVGRQDFSDGPIQLVSVRENPNIHFRLDGARAWAIAPTRRIDVFEYRYVDEAPGVFGEGTDTRKRFRGAVAGFRLDGALSGLYLEPFWYAARDDDRRWGASVGREERDFLGVRLWGARGPMTLDVAAVHQSGDFDGRDIRAYAVFSDLRWALSGEGTKPTLGFHADISSGGGAYGEGPLRNASFLFGTSPYFSFGNFIGGTNLIDIAPTFQFAPSASTSIALEWEWLWRHREQDAVYSGGGTPYAGTEQVDGRRIGHLLRLNANWRLSRYWSLTGRVERLTAGPVLEDAGYDDATFVGTWATFRF